MLRREVVSVSVRRVVELEEAVDRTLAVVADAHKVSVEELLAAAARHVARTQGGLRQPVYRLAPHIPLPDDGPPAPVAEVVHLEPRVVVPSPASLAHLDDVVRLYRDELHSMREVAAKVGLSVPTVQRLLVWAKVRIRPRGWIPGKNINGARRVS